MGNSHKKVITTGEVAEILGININTVIKWFDSGTLSGFKLPMSNERRIPISSLRKFMYKNSIPLDFLNENTPMQRMFQRIDCNESAKLSVINGKKSKEQNALIKDVSEGGARIEMTGEGDLSIPFSDFSLFLNVTDGHLGGAQWSGKITHMNPTKDRLSIGIQFENLADDEKERLSDFLDEKLS